MNKKYLKYALLVGVGLLMAVSADAAKNKGDTGSLKLPSGNEISTDPKKNLNSIKWSPNEISVTHNNVGIKIQKVMEMIHKLGEGAPILDVTSVPAHAVVATEQEFIRLRTEFEDEVKKQIKERVSVKYEPKKNSSQSNNDGSSSGSSGTSSSGTGDNSSSSHSKNKIDAKLSKVKIDSKEANKAVEEGIAGKGVKLSNGKNEIEYEGETSTYDLTINQQANWVSGVGDVEKREIYENRRRYLEQEQAIRLLAAAAVLRSNVAKNILEEENSPIEKANKVYEESDAKKDLSGKNSSGKSDSTGKSGGSGESGTGGNTADSTKTVELTNDYNQALRQYAYHSLVYDQLLSLEQQIIGLRLQTRAGRYAQGMDPLTDKLSIDGKKDPTDKDETKRDKDTGTGTREND